MLDAMMKACRRPEPYESGEELWNDAHISKMMLKAHLDPKTDAASYIPDKMESICGFLTAKFGLPDGGRIVDLGCGPGLYCEKLAEKGFRMTGIDRSENSLDYAKRRDRENRIEYRNASYLDPFGSERYEAATMISQDYGVLSPAQRRRLLDNIYCALRPGGYFAFDVPSMAAYRERCGKAEDRWDVSGPGFWRPHRHMVLERTVVYPEISALCDLHVVLDDAGVAAYRIYQTYFTPESISKEIAQGGLRMEGVYSGLDGEPYRDGTPVLGVLCRKI